MLALISGLKLAYDEDSRQLVIVKGNPGGDYTVIGPAVQQVTIADVAGDEVAVDDDGHLEIVQGEVPHWFGLPQYAIDAAAEIDDSYYDLMVTTKVCTRASVYVETNDAIISFDGGTTDHFFLDKDAGQVLLTGLKIPVGATISGKNAVGAADYVNLRIAVW